MLCAFLKAVPSKPEVPCHTPSRTSREAAGAARRGHVDAGPRVKFAHCASPQSTHWNLRSGVWSGKPFVSSLRVVQRSRSCAGVRNSCFPRAGRQGGQIDGARCVVCSFTHQLFCVPLSLGERYVFAHVFHAWEAALFRKPSDDFDLSCKMIMFFRSQCRNVGYKRNIGGASPLAVTTPSLLQPNNHHQVVKAVRSKHGQREPTSLPPASQLAFLVNV